MNFIHMKNCVLVEIVHMIYSGSEKDKFVSIMWVVIQKRYKEKVEIDKKCQGITPYLKMIGVIIKETARFL